MLFRSSSAPGAGVLLLIISGLAEAIVKKEILIMTTTMMLSWITNRLRDDKDL